MDRQSSDEDENPSLQDVVIRGPFATQDDCFTEIARLLINEHARRGWSRGQVLALFRNPRAVEAHTIYTARGEARIQALIAEQVPEDRPPAPIEDGCGDGPACWTCPNKNLSAASCARTSPIRRVFGRLAGWFSSQASRPGS